MEFHLYNRHASRRLLTTTCAYGNKMYAILLKPSFYTFIIMKYCFVSRYVHYEVDNADPNLHANKLTAETIAKVGHNGESFNQFAFNLGKRLIKKISAFINNLNEKQLLMVKKKSHRKERSKMVYSSQRRYKIYKRKGWRGPHVAHALLVIIIK